MLFEEALNTTKVKSDKLGIPTGLTQAEVVVTNGTDSTNKALFDISCSPITFTNGDPIIP